MKDLFKGWLSNVLVAVVTAIMAVMQEVLIDTEYSFITFLCIGGSIGIAMSIATEIAKSVFWDHRWSWADISTGALVGVITAYIMALAVC